MARTDKGQTSTYIRQVLNSPELLTSIRLLQDIVSSCYGPFSKIKTVQNSSGGHVTLTSTSQRLFKVLSLSKPVLKLVVGSIQYHLRAFNDGGLFSTALTLHLIEEGISLEIPCRLIIDAFDLFLDISTRYLKSQDCEVKYSLKDSGLSEIFKLTRSIIEPKWHGCSSKAHLEFIVQLTVEAFLKSVSISQRQTSTPESVHFILIPCHVVTESKLFCGVLLDLCGRATPSRANLKCIEDLSLSGNQIPVVIISVSLAGDLEDFIQAGGYDVAVEVDVNRVSESRLLRFAQELVLTGTKVVFCQKVIHPDINTYLRHRGIFSVDRLGAAACKTVQQLTGAHLISMVSDTIDSSCLALLGSLSVEEICGKSYLLLSENSSPDVTVVLCHRQEEILEEIRVASEAAIHSLYLNLHQPKVLTGGGCWQVHLAYYLQSQVSADRDELVDKLKCSTLQLLSVCSAFSRSLQLCAISIGQPRAGHKINSTDRHLWRVQHVGIGGLEDQESAESFQTCCCGSSKRETTELSYLSSAASQNSVFRMRMLEKGKTTEPKTDFGSHGNHTDMTEANEIMAESMTNLNLEASKKSHQKSGVCMPEPTIAFLSGLQTLENKGSNYGKTDLDRIQVLDSFPVQLNAFHTGVSTAMAVLNVSQYIQDTN